MSLGGPPLGNNNAENEFSIPLLKKMFESFLAHLSKGKDKKSWFWDDDVNHCTYKTLLRHCAKDPVVFPPKRIENALSRGYQEWEAITEDTAKGSNRKANVAALRMVMRNKFKWDAPEADNTEADPDIQDKFNALIGIFGQDRKIDASNSKADDKS